MAKKQEENTGYLTLRENLKNKTPRRLYVFYGEERYLLEDALRTLRAMIPEGTEGFNHRRLEGKGLTMDVLAEAVNAYPAFSDLTLTEVRDFDFSRLGEEARGELLSILSEIPDYAVVVFVFDTAEYKLDGRIKAYQELKKHLSAVEFQIQDERSLSNWIVRRLRAGGKRITNDALRELIAMTGGSMTNLHTEIEKLISYCPGEAVTLEDVEAVVTPIPDAQIYTMTDAMLSGESDKAVRVLGELLRMNEAPHRILYSVGMKLRQLMLARVLRDAGGSMREFMKLGEFRYEFQARLPWSIAGRTPLSRCARLLRLTSDTAYKLNSSPQDDGELLRELVLRILLETGVRA